MQKSIKLLHTIILITVLSVGTLIFTNSTNIEVSNIFTVVDETIEQTISNTNQLAQVSGAGSGLIAHYTFDEGSGTTAGDSAGSNTGTLVTGTSSPTWVGGRIGQAISLDGQDDHVNIGVKPEFGGLNTVTISAWVYPKNAWVAPQPFINNLNLNSNSGFGIGGAWDGGASTRVWINGTALDFSRIAVPAINKWTHIALTYDSVSNKAIVYKDGVASIEKSAASLPIAVSSYPFVIGKFGAKTFDGFIDDVRVYNKVLTSQEINSVYSGVSSVVVDPSDTTPPSVPASVSSSNILDTKVAISWEASSDNVAVTGYKVFRNNVQLSVVNSGTTYTDNGLSAGSTYLYKVSAFDASGNESNTSSPVSVTTVGQSVTSFGTTKISLPNVLQGRQTYAGQNIMWKDNAGVIHIINAFGGADVNGSEKAYIHYINTQTGASALVEGGKCSFGRASVYDSVHNKFYWYGEYCSYMYGGSFNEFDPVTMTNRVIKEGGDVWWSGQSLAMGEDNKIYFTAIHGNQAPARLYSYDPSVGPSSWKDMGVIFGASNGTGPGMYIDKTHIYVAWQDNTSNAYRHLMVRPIADGSWSEIDFGDGYPLPGYNLNILVDKASLKPFLRRLSSSGTKYYWLTNGGVTLITGPIPSTGSQTESDIIGKGHVSMMGYGNYSQFITGYNYDMNWDNLIPNPGNPVSSVSYGPHGSWNYPTSGFKTSSLKYNGPWHELPVSGIVPHAGNKKFYALGTLASDYDYSTQKSTSIGTLPANEPYFILRVPATHSPLGVDEIYYSGYPNLVYRWNPTTPITGRVSNINPTLVKSSEHMNYRLFMDYDSAGKIWIGGNACGATKGCVDYGGVAWYEPVAKTTGEMFSGVWTGGNPPATGNGIKFTNLAISNSRSKVVVSSNDGKLTVINALTKTIEGTYNLGATAFMVEVSNDRVLGVTTSSDSSGPRVFLFKPSDRTMAIAPKSIGVSGNPFGTQDGLWSRKSFKLELGPDGYAWLYVDNKIYRVNPTTLEFQYVVTDDGKSSKLKWSHDGIDLITYGGENGYFPNLLNKPTSQIPNNSNEPSPVIPAPPIIPLSPPVIVPPQSTPVTTPLDSDSDSIPNISDKCPNTPRGVRVNNYGCAIPLTTKFTITNNIDNADLNSIPSFNIGNTLGRIIYNIPVSLVKTTGDRLDIDSNLSITKGYVSLDSTRVPELNKGATVTLYNITATKPKIMKDGVLCTVCTIVSFTNGTLVFTVPSF